MSEVTKSTIERLFAAHHHALLAFLYRRLRHRTDAADLAQEVYERMLRVKNPEAILDIHAYLFTVAKNLAREQAARDQRRGTRVDIQDGAIANELAEEVAYEAQIDATREIGQLRTVLRQLPARWHAAIILQYVHGLTHQQIAEQLGVSARTVKKILGQALGRCRNRMVRLG